MNWETAMTKQTECGYSNAAEYREELLEIAPAIEVFRNAGGIISVHSVKSHYETVYTCEDAQAWGTRTEFPTLEGATAHFNHVMNTLVEACSVEDEE